MTRYVLTVNLLDAPVAIQAYRDYHRRVWPEVLESLRTVGVERMDIYQLGRQLVMIVELADGLDFRSAFASHMESSARVTEWEDLMRSLQEPSSDAPDGDWWATMEQVFQIEASEPVAARSADRSRTP